MRMPASWSGSYEPTAYKAAARVAPRPCELPLDPALTAVMTLSTLSQAGAQCAPARAQDGGAAPRGATRLRPDPRQSSAVLAPSRPLRAAFGGGLRPALTALARGARWHLRSGRSDGPPGRTKRCRSPPRSYVQRLDKPNPHTRMRGCLQLYRIHKKSSP